MCPIIAPCTFPISFNTFPIDHQVSSRSWKMLIAADWLVMLITADDAGIFLLHFHHFLSLAFSSISDTFLHFLVLSDKLAHLKSISKELDADWIQIFPPLLKMTKMWGILTLGCQDRGFTQYLNWISTMTNISVRRQYLIWIFEYLIWIFEYLNRD